MSRDLVILIGMGILCIILSPLYKEYNLPILHKRPKFSQATKTYEHSKTIAPKQIVLLVSDFLPDTFAGSEVSAYETIKYLRDRGNSVTVISERTTVKSYDDFPIYKYSKTDKYIKSTIQHADIVLFQVFGHSHEKFDCIKERTKPTFLFIHINNQYQWIIQTKISFPLTIVFNSEYTKATNPTSHSNLTMIPYVNTEVFKPLRAYTGQIATVGLMNCNKRKGGKIFREIAAKLPNVRFIGVKGAYGNNDDTDSSSKTASTNITYYDPQKDVRPIYKNIGILIMPSIEETWGRTAVEAMAAGIPVIHSEAEGLVECVGGAGIQCNRDDIDAWCAAIQRIIGDRAYRERLRQNGFMRVEQIESLQREQRFALAETIER